MKLFQLTLCLLLVSIHHNSVAADVACPDLKAAVQVGVCPTEDQLKYTFTGYCSDDTKAYKGETDVCTDFQRYRQMKNIVLWESADGVFDAYVSCDLSKDELQRTKVSGLRLGKQGKQTQLVCSYGDGVKFTYRTRAQCKLDAGVNCSAAPQSCKASCD